VQKDLLRKVAIAALLLASLGACALNEDNVPIDYIPPDPPAPIAGAGAVKLEVTATDQRAQYRDRVSVKKNMYGMEMARIIATNDVVDLVRSGVERGLRSEGFAMGPGGLTVGIDLQNFYNNFQSGGASGLAVAEVAFALKVRNASGALVYSQFYSATNTNDGLVLASGANAKASLEKATTMAVKQMLDDKALQDALIATATKPGAKSAPGNRRPGS
jgi:uncharacterized lipoprotein